MKYGVCNSRFFETFGGPERIKVYYGGGGSGKSLSLIQYFIMQLCNGDGFRRAILRKTFPSMKASTYLVLKEVLDDWGIPYEENKSDHVIRVGNNSLFYLSLDNSEKIKGAEFKEIWLEEATEFTLQDYKQLRIRLSRTSEDAVIYMSFNPIDQDHWVITDVVNKAPNDDNIFVHHSTYKDNVKFLAQSMIDTLEGFIDEDENFYRIYALGLPGVLKGQIYKNWDFSEPKDWQTGWYQGMHFYMMDFGFNNPMSLVECWYYEGEYYLKELLYETGLTTNDLIGRMEGMNISKTDEIFCDSAEPDRIQELCNSRRDDSGRMVGGYLAKPSKKAVKPGIDHVKGQTIHVDATCSPNIYTEYNNYKWKETKDGVSTDEPVKAFDHAMDAIRYGIFTAPTEPVRAVSNVRISRPSFGGFASSRPTF